MDNAWDFYSQNRGSIPLRRTKYNMKIYDCLLFNNEFDLLEVRLIETFDKVDQFVIVESDLTFTGKPKQLHLHNNWERFKPWADKITLLQGKGLDANNNPWVNEACSRESLGSGIIDANPEDYIMLSDSDELYRASTFDLMKQHEELNYGFRIPYFSFKLNYLQTGPYPRPWWSAGCATRKSNLTNGIEALRQQREMIGHNSGRVIGHAGWHFNNIGTDKEIREKLGSFSHEEVNTDEVLKRLNVEQLIERGEGLFPDATYHTVEFDNYFPASMHADKWNKFVLSGSGNTREIMKQYPAFARYQSTTT